ncbi:MAG: hypothetical protein ACLR6J_06945 [Parabacteroides merdae]
MMPTYILTITTAEGKFDTPNLRGNDAPVPSIDPETKHWKIGEEDTGVVSRRTGTGKATTTRKSGTR